MPYSPQEVQIAARPHPYYNLAMIFLLSEHSSDPVLRVFSRMSDSELRDPKQLVGLSRATGIRFSDEGIFIAESRNVIERALNAGLQPFALISEQRWLEPHRDLFERIENLEQNEELGVLRHGAVPRDGVVSQSGIATHQAAIPQHDSIPQRGTVPQGRAIFQQGNIPQYIGTHAEIEKLTGFKRTVGPIAAFHRPALPSLDCILSKARRVAVLEDITNFTNIGAIFRSAAALGMDAILITPGCHDPFYRRAARVSMGTVFQVPWTRIEKTRTWAEEGIPLLKQFGFTSVALALKEDSLRLQDPRIVNAEKLALVLGTEGDGLARTTIAHCDYTVKIPMAHNVDSLNVAAASAVAFWETCGRFK